ncbi:MAG: peptide deformylase [Candidatus Saccharibacteria bacterium]|nr:peptide deformylase [Candidatus Saccharibacteria bacterium]
MLLKIHQAGQPILRKQAKTVTESVLRSRETQDLIDHMIETLRDVPGVGLSASQVGSPLNICIMEDKAAYHKPLLPEVLMAQGRKEFSLKVLVNPRLEIIETEPEIFFEGCLSVEGYVGVVPRASKVRVTATDRHGEALSFVAKGWQARILQHEVDHLHGILYIDKVRLSSFMNIKNFNNLWRDALQPKIEKHFI